MPNQMQKVISRKTIMLALFVLFMPLANAQSDEQRTQRRGPPVEAFEACVNQPQEAACSFTGRRGEVQGSCIIPPRQNDATLVCAPEGGPPHHRRQKSSG